MQLLQTGNMDRFTELKNMPFESLAEIVSRFPWFGAAQKILCERMIEIGGRDWGTAQFAEAAMHVASRRRISSLLRKEFEASEEMVASIIRKYISAVPSKSAAVEPEPIVNSSFRGVGDYFSSEQYAMVKKADDDAFRNFRSSDDESAPVELINDLGMDFCTETLAQIYEEQGYYQQAKDIYSKLILAYPEKNAYFAALIEKLNAEIKN